VVLVVVMVFIHHATAIGSLAAFVAALARE
jgi:hypothetical protein